jgi:hypothetical protein
VARDPDAVQLRAVVPLVVAATKQLVGPALIVTNNQRAIAVTGSELLRPHDAKSLALLTSLDGSSSVPVAAWGLGRYSGVGLVELGGPIAAATRDVTPLSLSAVHATVDSRGAPSALITIVANGDGTFDRVLVPVHVDHIDNPAGMVGDVLARLASPIEPADHGRSVAGAILFSWFPSDPVLGRKSEVVAVALAYPYTLGTFKPRDLPAIAELLGLDDLGRALITPTQPDPRPELAQVTGEIADSPKT